MKIGVVTFHRAHNCGAALQCLALVVALRRLGHEAMAVDCNSLGQGSMLPQSKGLRIWLGWMHLTVKTWARSQRNWMRYWMFAFRYIPMTRRIAFGKPFPKDLDCCILGSDQVLNPLLIKDNADTFLMLNRCEDSKKVAYAASFGLDSLPEAYRVKFSEGLKRFSSVGMREESGRIICRQELGLDDDVAVVADPTLLLEAKDYLKYERKVSVSGRYVLVFWIGFATDYLISLAEQVAHRHGMKVVVATPGLIPDHPDWLSVDPSQFLYLIRHAACVVTTSFHATSFSIINRVPFVTVIPKALKVPGRITFMLEKFGLSDRTVNEGEFMTEDALSDLLRVDYLSAEERINDFRRVSLEFLRGALRNVQTDDRSKS